MLHTPDEQTSAPTAAVHVARPAGEVGSDAPFASCALQEPVPASVAVHQKPEPHSELVVHVEPHAPDVRSQTSPAWTLPVQSALDVHLPHAPATRQNGAVDDVQSNVFFVPTSPLHATQVLLVALQSGEFPVQAVAFVAVQATHAFVVGEHAPIPGTLQSPSDAHGSHVEAFGPLLGHTPDRHCDAPVPASPDEHAAPLTSPHSLSVVSHAPEMQARAPIAEVHVPPGTADPLATRSWQIPWPARLSHHCPTPQMASVEQVLPQAPVLTSHRGPAWLPAQSESAVQTPHVPAVWQ